MDLDRLGSLVNAAETVITVGNLAAGVYAALPTLRGQRKRAREGFERDVPQPKRLFPRHSNLYRRMPAMRNMRRRPRVSRRRTRRRVYKSVSEGAVTSLVRSSALGNIAISASTTSFSAINIKLSDVFTTDLLAASRLYRLKKVVYHIVPRIDPGNSILANNFQTFIAAACDCEDTSTPTSAIQVTSYRNSFQKFVTAADRFTYTFYPKAVNAVGNAGAASYTGSYAVNPWILMNAAGIDVPHQCLKLAFQVSSATTISFTTYADLYFEIRGTL